MELFLSNGVWNGKEGSIYLYLQASNFGLKGKLRDLGWECLFIYVPNDFPSLKGQ